MGNIIEHRPSSQNINYEAPRGSVLGNIIECQPSIQNTSYEAPRGSALGNSIENPPSSQNISCKENGCRPSTQDISYKENGYRPSTQNIRYEGYGYLPVNAWRSSVTTSNTTMVAAQPSNLNEYDQTMAMTVWNSVDRNTQLEIFRSQLKLAKDPTALLNEWAPFYAVSTKD